MPSSMANRVTLWAALLRLSLREMFLLTAAVALVIVSLVYATVLWQAIIGLMVMLLAMVALITSLVDRGARRAFWIGFAVAMLGYLLIVINAHKFTLAPTEQNVELDAYQGRLPTSLLLQHFYAGINRSGYYDLNSEKRISDAESANLSRIAGSPYGGMQTSTGRPVSYQERPPRENFMAIGHFWWALLFAYIGGRFARFVYLRRDQQATTGTH